MFLNFFKKRVDYAAFSKKKAYKFRQTAESLRKGTEIKNTPAPNNRTRRKRFSWRQRLSNIVSWFRHPGFLIGLTLCFGLFGLLLVIMSPCGRHGYVVNGTCDNGQALTSPLGGFLMGTVMGLVGFLLLGTSEAHDGKPMSLKLISSTIGQIKSRPKWRKKWFPLAFIVSYVSLGIINYFFNVGSELPLVYIIGQYGLLIPLFATYIASWILTKARRNNYRKRSY